MWRNAKIAFVGENARIAERLQGALEQIGLQEQIDVYETVDVAMTAYIEHQIDVLFVHASNQYFDELPGLVKFHRKAPTLVCILIADQLDRKDLALAINQARVDWLISPEINDEDLKDAMIEAKNLINARRRIQEMEFSRDVISVSGKPTAILDRNYHIVYSNTAADRLFASGDPFTVTSMRQLVCATSDETHKFHDAVRGSIFTHVKSGKSTYISINRTRQKTPVVVVSIPVHREIDNHFTYHIVINDPQQQRSGTAEDYAVALNVTLSEARLIEQLARGRDLERAAADMNITINTARGYLKGAFEKTGVSRQAEIVRLALLSVS